MDTQAARDAAEQQFLELKERVEKEEMASYITSREDKRIRRMGGLEIRRMILSITSPEPEDSIDLSTDRVATNQILIDPKPYGERPATVRMINQLCDLVVTQRHIDLDPTCIICYSDFAVNETINVMPACQHYFHKKCIRGWLVQAWTCPICRERLRFSCLDQARRLQGEAGEQQPIIDISTPIFKELIQICVWAKVNRHGARLPRSMRNQSFRIGTKYPVADHAEACIQVYRKCETAFSETVLIIYTVPSSIRVVNVHFNVPISASSLVVKASIPGHFSSQLVHITAQIVLAQKEVSATRDIGTMVISGNSEQCTNLITNIPAMPAEVGLVNGVEGRARRYRMEEIHSNENLVDIPTFLQFSPAWQETGSLFIREMIN